VTGGSGNTPKWCAIELRERFRDECWVSREFQDGICYPAARSWQVLIDSIPHELPARTLVMEAAPEDQPTLLDRCDINETAEVLEGIGRKSLLLSRHRYLTHH